MDGQHLQLVLCTAGERVPAMKITWPPG